MKMGINFYFTELLNRQNELKSIKAHHTIAYEKIRTPDFLLSFAMNPKLLLEY